jgi:hypothetical protein
VITAKVNCSLIDKSKLFKGAKGTYLDLVLFETENDQYGNDYVVVQSVSKEDRAKGIKGVILGNARIIHSQKMERTEKPARPAVAGDAAPEGGDNVPF